MYIQDIISKLKSFWAQAGCFIAESYDKSVGAGTLSPTTTLMLLSNERWNAAYAQACRRPADGRYAKNPNRLQHYYQFQVIMKPIPPNFQELMLKSYKALDFDFKANDIKFLEDDWENPTVGASGLGWEVWVNGMEVGQYTYMQQIGGKKCIAAEITYGIERLGMYLQDVDVIMDLKWADGVYYRDLFFSSEVSDCKYNFEYSDPSTLLKLYDIYSSEAERLLEAGLIQPAYSYCLDAIHTFNLLDARGVISSVERVQYMSTLRALACSCCEAWSLSN